MNWKGIAIAGVWIGVGMVGLNSGEAAGIVSIGAAFASLFIAIA